MTIQELIAQYPGQTAEQLAVVLNTPSVVVPISRFTSFRGMANLLTDEEYNTLRGLLGTIVAQEQAAGGHLIGDMVEMLKLPCDDDGAVGGLDMGNARIQGKLAQLCGPVPALNAVPGKLAAFASKTLTPLQVNRMPPYNAAQLAVIMKGIA